MVVTDRGNVGSRQHHPPLTDDGILLREMKEAVLICPDKLNRQGASLHARREREREEETFLTMISVERERGKERERE